MTTLLRIAPLVVAVVLQTGKTEPGFTQLFNGKDWTGWKVANEASFKIADGAIVANGSAGHAYYDGPLLNHSFRNFELKVDIMTKANSNGGVFVLTQFQEKGFPSIGFEIQVNNTYARDPVKSGSVYHLADITEAPAKDDEWFTEHITVKDNTITVRVNDTQVVQWTQPVEWATDPKFAKRLMSPGTIALQAHDPGSTVHYKNIRIKPL
jgi:Domain of Unknown Function (DUF1080)